MRAAVITEFNKPWEMKDVADPRPEAGQVVIKIHASGMCGTDVHTHHGYLPVKTPIVAGHEPAGEIVELGQGVTNLKVGDRVGVHWTQKGCGRCAVCQSGHENHCQQGQSWMNIGGGNSELMLAWAAGCTILPEGLAYEAAAPVFCAGFTVMSGLRNANPRAGERIAILGVGGLGHLALQYSRALGFETWALTGQENKVKELKDLGAHEVLVTKDQPGKALMDVGGADVILSTTNSAAHVSQAIEGLRPHGRLVAMGLSDGAIQVAPMALMMAQRQLIGSSQNNRQDLVEALALVGSGKVKPVIEAYPIDQANQVRDRLEAGKVRYRAVLQHA